MKTEVLIKKKRTPRTKEEKKVNAREHYREGVSETKELEKKTYVPPSPAKMLRMIEKIGRQKVADDVGFPVSFIVSWRLYHIKGDTKNGWDMRGRILTDLQEYFGRIN